MIDPLQVVCPKCQAAVTAKCTEPVRDGSKFVDYFHQDRIDLARNQIPPEIPPLTSMEFSEGRRITFRRICTACLRLVDWTEASDFFHVDDKSPLCPGGSVNLEFR